MDYKYIEQLLERYFEAETTLKEEHILKSFFEQTDEELPQDLRQYKALFAAMEQQDALDDDFDEQVLALTEEKTKVKARTVSLSDRLKPLFRAAAVVAIFLTLSNALNQSFKADNVWTDEEQVAEYQKAIRNAALLANKDSLMLLSEELSAKTDSLTTDSIQIHF
jgi:hypothetical protein